MNRTGIAVAIVAVAALTLSACSSSADDAATTTSTTTSAVESADNAAGDTETDASQGAASEDTDDAESADEPDTSDGPAAPVELDEQSTAWFSTFCGVSEPFGTMFMSLMSASMIGSGAGNNTPEQLVQLRDGLATSFGDLGDAMTSVGGELKNMPPPTVAGGAEAAQTVVGGLASGGPALHALAQQVSEIDTTDATTFGAGINEMMSSIDTLSDSLGLDKVDFDDATMAAVEQVPACQGSMLFGAL